MSDSDYGNLVFFPTGSDSKVEELHRNYPDHIFIGVPFPKTEHALRIFQFVLPRVLDLFVAKSNRYGEPDDDDLGLAGQFSDLDRKYKIMKRVMWNGEKLPEGGEPIEEVLADMIGHCLKAIEFYRKGKLK